MKKIVDVEERCGHVHPSAIELENLVDKLQEDLHIRVRVRVRVRVRTWSINSRKTSILSSV